MRICSMDFGGSTVDVLEWENGQIQSIESYESVEISTQRFQDFMRTLRLKIETIDAFRVTGGKSHFFADEFQGIPLVRVDEIQAIGAGGQWLLKETLGNRVPQEALTVSMGTGTCMVASRSLKHVHLGGTGVGGGTFLSLCRLLLQESEPERLIELFNQGDRKKVDLSVRDIVGRDIGRISADMTASNLGKLAYSKEIDFSKADLAAGITNLIGQTIAIASVFAAQAEHLNTIVLTGKLTRIKSIVDIIFEVGKVYGLKMILPKNADYVGAIGAFCKS
ncbi:MAG: pantothenate kinase, type II pantothenate kinase [Candidatus Peregrinibacteria bacterium GW2011_GWF2_39_17]|nr:MAG: pantothenate kinase, type II pantothenate kinase [Candidatus Peregrinibacteria bacterium GW2011_GWF2_39_17]HCW32128.1 hypothetical protein [Candidatus Peregrinibacteria bacterium]